MVEKREEKEKKESNEIIAQPRSTGKSYGMLALELFTVTFGVLLGFAINQMTENISAKKQQRAAVVAVNEEIKSNLLEIEDCYKTSSRAFCVMMTYLDSIEVFQQRNQVYAQSDLTDISLVTPKATAWNTFQQQGLATSLDFNQVKAMTDIYANYGFFNEVNQRILDKVTSFEIQDPNKVREVSRSFTLVINQQVTQSFALRENMVAYLKRYDPRQLTDTTNVDSLRRDFQTKVKEIQGHLKHYLVNSRKKQPDEKS